MAEADESVFGRHCEAHEVANIGAYVYNTFYCDYPGRHPLAVT
jgi:hypothetical protein